MSSVRVFPTPSIHYLLNPLCMGIHGAFSPLVKQPEKKNREKQKMKLRAIRSAGGWGISKDVKHAERRFGSRAVW